MTTTTQTGTSASTVRANASGAAAATSGGQAKCDFCARQGLPVLPLRYAVMPSYLTGATGNPIGWAQLGKEIQGQAPQALQGHRYTLRALRRGYLMVYLGTGLWNAYAVNAAGHLRKLADIDDPDHKGNREMSEACMRAGHNVPASFITIPTISSGRYRKMPTKVWIAFSDVLWTKKTREQYERVANGAPALKGRRFQSFVVDSLGLQADTVQDAFQLHPDEAATARRLNSLVLEYATDDAQAKTRSAYDAIDPHDAKKRNHMQWKSAHGVAMRTGQASAVAKHATTLTPSYKSELMASAIVLDDPVGMVQELNATRLQMVESRQRYLADARISRPLLISQSISGLKTLIGEQALAAVTEQEKGQPDVQTEQVYTIEGIPLYSETTTRQERAEHKAATLWSSLQSHYREADRLAFEKTVAATLKSFQDWIVKGDADYAIWLGLPNWVLRCRDFDTAVPEQQDLLHEVMAAALQGGPTAAPAESGPKDTRVYEVWKRFFGLPPTDEANPIFVALFGFDQDILEYLVPEGPNPLDDKINKGSKLYKVIKTVIGTKELASTTKLTFDRQILTRDATTNKVPNPVRVAGATAMDATRQRITAATTPVADVLLTIGGSLNRMVSGAVTQVAEATVLRAVQAAVLLYERREIYLVTSRVRLREYVGYLNDIAFKASDSVIDVGIKAARNVTRTGKNTVRSMAIAGVLSIPDKRIAETLVEVTHWAVEGLDNLGKSIESLPPERQAARAAHEAAQAAAGAESTAMLATMRAHPFSLSPSTQQFVDSVCDKASKARVGTATAMKTMTTATFRLASTGSGILAVGSLVVQSWSLKDNLKKADAAFIGNNEARVLVGAASIATIGATVELVGVSAKLLGKGWAGAWTRLGGTIGAAASIVEGVQAVMASHRTASRGDYDASALYFVAGASLVTAGVVGMYGALTGAALLGPIGWALILIAVGVGALYLAARAEDSQAEIWLDRCYWGHGLRFKLGSHPADRPWTEDEIDQELAQLNAIIIGLAGEIGFNDDGLGLADWTWDTVKARITLPMFKQNDSAYEWKFLATGSHGGGEGVLAWGKHGSLPSDPNAVSRPAAGPKGVPSDRMRNLRGPSHTRTGKSNDVLIIEVSAEVQVKYFSNVELVVDYVSNMADPRGRASLRLSEKD